MDTTKLHQIVDLMPQAKVLVIGDVMLDIYEHCVVKRISPEAPVPIATVTRESYFLGGAGNVANNLRALGASVSLIGVVGNDESGHILRTLFIDSNIDHEGVIVDPKRVTTQKKRVVSGTQQLMRIDREVTENIDPSFQDSIRAIIEKKVKDCDVVIISDYCKGFIDAELLTVLRSASETHNKKVLVDSKDRAFFKYAGFYLVKPNKEEAEHFTGERFHPTYKNLESIGKKLQEIFQSHIVITLGGDGIALFENETFLHKPTRTREVFDVSGAGDTVLATITMAIAAGATLEQAMHLSNCAAGYVVGCLGTTVCTPEILKERLDELL